MFGMPFVECYNVSIVLIQIHMECQIKLENKAKSE
jgi:hypothetical protein